MGNTLKNMLFTFKSKSFIIKLIGMIGLLLFVYFNSDSRIFPGEEIIDEPKKIVSTQAIEMNLQLAHSSFTAEQEEIQNEIYYGEIEEVALTVQAEAGNQDELGKRYVADVIWNRIDDKDFPDKPLDVIYQIDPVQFATTVNGAMGKAGYTITEEVFQIALEERESRTNSEIIYFRADRYGAGTPAFKHGDHYFSTK